MNFLFIFNSDVHIQIFVVTRTLSVYANMLFRKTTDWRFNYLSESFIILDQLLIISNIELNRVSMQNLRSFCEITEGPSKDLKTDLPSSISVFLSRF